MSEWKEYKLKDVADVQTGPFGSQLHQSDYKAIGTPIITVEHLGENKILHQNLPLVGDKDKQRLNKYLLEEGDIVFSRVGSVDRRAYVSKKENGWMFSGRCLRVRANKKKVEPRFLSFYFGQESFKEHIRMIAVGATMPSINTDILSSVAVALPPLHEQESIASILSSLDDKIDLLHRQNKILEALAETLFRQWFVEEAEERWEAGTVKDFFTLQRGFDLPAQDRRDGKYPIISASGVNGYHNEGRVQAPGVTTGRSGLLGQVFYIMDDFWPLNTSLFIVEYKLAKPLFAYFFLETLDLEGLNGGSAVPTLNRNDVHSLEASLPPLELIDRFESLTQAMFRKVKENKNQIRTLTRLRDMLLPKLMSGKVRVKDDKNSSGK